MKISPKLFVKLCESVLSEVSTMKKIVAHIPHGKTLLHVLHSRYDVPHDQKWIETDDISWKQIKDTERAWVILRCKFGVGAISWQGSEYVAVTVKDGNIERFNNERAGYAKDFIKERIGPIRKIFVGMESEEHYYKRQNRASSRTTQSSKEISLDDLYRRFSPLFKKTIEHAVADIKGVTQSMIKNDAFKKVNKKIDRLQELEKIIDEINENGKPDYRGESVIKHALNNAIALAAVHYYRDIAGEIQKSYDGKISPTNYQVRDKLLQDIADGNTEKLGAVLKYFKRGLL